MDPSKILIWNVRGLNSTGRQDAVRSLVESTKADIVCIQETKMENISRRVVLAALGSKFNQYVFVPSIGASGGILVAWKHDLGPAGSTRIDAHSASVQFQPTGREPWWLTCVYGPQGSVEKI
jgi:mannosylglycoprotein endo-beta-mannosidase